MCDALVTTIREKAAPVRIGIDIGGTDMKIGLVDVHQKLIASVSVPTRAERPAKAVIGEAGERTLALLEKQGIAIDQCVGVGVGAPGTVDRAAGVVRYSNNIGWENVKLAEELGKYLPLPVRIANDADCAAFGETIAGAGKACQDVVMITLGTGVGGGIILDGEIYEGGGLGGSELGHMVIVEDGEPCTCGRRGCLEAYVSATALKRDARRAVGRDMQPEEIFAAAAGKVSCPQKISGGSKAEEAALKEVVDLYIRRLGTGIVNIVNIFRPQLVILGGGLCAQEETFLAPIREMLAKNCFGGTDGDLPEVAIALLGDEAGMIGAASLI